MTRSQVYFMRPVGQAGPVKIGCSIAPEGRLRSYSALSPIPLEMIATIPGDGDIERRFHALFAADHSHHEWFHWTQRMAGVLEQIKAGTFDVVALPKAKRLPQISGRSPEVNKAAGYAIRLTALQKRGVSIPPEVVAAQHQWRCSKDEVRAKRAIIREFVDRMLSRQRTAA